MKGILEYGELFAGGGKLKVLGKQRLRIAWVFCFCVCYKKTKQNIINFLPALCFAKDTSWA